MYISEVEASKFIVVRGRFPQTRKYFHSLPFCDVFTQTLMVKMWLNYLIHVVLAAIKTKQCLRISNCIYHGYTLIHKNVCYQR